MPTLVMNGFPWWAVLGLMGASAVALWLLHRLRIQPNRVPVVTTLFWREAAQQAQASTLHKQFRHPLTYLLLLAICLLLALALGDPIFGTSNAKRQWNVVVVDAGAGMSTQVAGRSWWQEAHSVTLGEVAQLPSQNPVAVVVCDPLPRLVLEYEEPREWLSLRLAVIEPATTPADRFAALKLADDLVQQTDSAGEIILVSPLAAPQRITDTLTSEVRSVAVGEPVDNAAILSAVFEANSDDPGRGDVVARIGYWGAAPRSVRVQWSDDQGATLGSDELQLTPGGEQTLVRQDVAADGSMLTLKLDTADGLTADNQLSFQLPRRPKLKAVMQGAADTQLALLLESTAAVEIVETDQAELIISNEATPTTLPQISIAASGSAIDAPQVVTPAGNTALVAGLQFNGQTCGVGAALKLVEGDEPCLLTGEQCVAAVNLKARPPTLRLSPALFADDATVRNHPALAAFITRATRALAGWQSTLIQPADRVVSDPLWPQRSGVAVASVAGSRLTSDTFTALSEPAEASTYSAGGSWRWFQIIIAVAVLMAGVEAFLHARARIP